MRWITLFAAVLLAGLAAVPAGAQGWATGFNMVLDNCQDRSLDPDIRIKMCSEIIHSNLLTPGITGAIYEERAEAYAQKHDTENALSDFAKSISLKPDLAQTYTNRGNMLEGIGRSAEAVKDFERAGYFHLKHNECQYGEPDFSEALKIDPKFAAALYGRGLCEQRQGKKELGQADIDQALKLDPAVAQNGDWPSND